MKKRLLILIAMASLLTLAGCSQSNHSAAVNSSSKPAATKQREARTNIRILANGHVISAHLNHSSAGRAFAKKLPTTLTFDSFPGSNPEKMADLKYSLPTKGMPSGHAGDQGTIGYWSPDRRIIFYYGHVAYYPGIHIIGRFDSNNYHRVIAHLPNHTQVQISKVK